MSAAPGYPAQTKYTGRRGTLSYASLLNDVSWSPQPPRRRRPDAIIVPATRPASALAGIIALAAELGTFLVVICSMQTGPGQVMDRIRRHPGARGIALRLSAGYRLPIELRTMSDEFDGLAPGRSSDLSLNRNFGLLLARRCGWRTILFVDDDITLGPTAVSRLVHQLSSTQVAGMACRSYPDNSVFCHARRLVGLKQDVFVTGAALGVSCSDHPIPFFPNIYNEDWFFFGEAVAQHQLQMVGEARQAQYHPFSDKARAVREEFGDLLAEGLYSLIQGYGAGCTFGKATELAGEDYWDQFIKQRRSEIEDIWRKLLELVRPYRSDDVFDALKSLDAADRRYLDQIDPITPDRCTAFLDAWREDAENWRDWIEGITFIGSVEESLASLDAQILVTTV